LTLLLTCGAALPVVAAARDHEPSRVKVERDPETLVTHVTVTAHRGRVAWADVLAGLARAKGYDDTAFADELPDKTFSLHRRRTAFVVGLGNAVLPRGIRVAVVRPKEADGEPALRITLDRAATLASKRRFQKFLREIAATFGSDLFASRSGSRRGLDLDDEWAKTPADKDLVVVIPGFQSRPDQAGPLAEAVRKAGLPVGVFRYPNDQPIEDSAQLLASELKDLVEDHPDRRVRIVGLSMGGLVARRAVEDPDLDPGNVVQLVLIAPPNHGSSLARFGFALELWEHLVRSSRRDALERFYASIEDGLGEASDDLRPDSPFLRELNARSRNPRVRYSIFLGTGGRLTGDEVAALRRYVAARADRHRFVRVFGPKLDGWLADLDEAVEGKGDGAVAVARGRLAGVDDVTLLAFDHLTLGETPHTDAERRLMEEVLKRLQMPVKKAT
jgi:pimeloyl-ACP methyl ester carboxylesterase